MSLNDSWYFCALGLCCYFKCPGTSLHCIMRPFLKWFPAILQLCKRLLFLEYSAQRVSSCVYFRPRCAVQLIPWRKCRISHSYIKEASLTSLHVLVNSVRRKQTGKSSPASIVNYHWKALRGVDSNIDIYSQNRWIYFTRRTLDCLPACKCHKMLQFVTIDEKMLAAILLVMLRGISLP